MSVEKTNFIIKEWSIFKFVDLIKQLGYDVDPNYEYIDSIFAFDKKKNCFVQRKNLVKNNFIEYDVNGLMERVVSSNKLTDVYMFLFKETGVGIEYIMNKLKTIGSFTAYLLPNDRHWRLEYDNENKHYIELYYSMFDEAYIVSYTDKRHSYRVHYEVEDVSDTNVVSKHIEIFKKMMNNE